MIEQGGKALAAYMKPREQGHIEGEHAEFVDAVKALGQVAQYWLQDPQRAAMLQMQLGSSYLDLWANSVKRMMDAGGTGVTGNQFARNAFRWLSPADFQAAACGRCREHDDPDRSERPLCFCHQG